MAYKEREFLRPYAPDPSPLSPDKQIAPIYAYLDRELKKISTVVSRLTKGFSPAIVGGMAVAQQPLNVDTVPTRIAPWLTTAQNFAMDLVPATIDIDNGQFVFQGTPDTNIGAFFTVNLQINIADLVQNNEVRVFLTNGTDRRLAASYFKSVPQVDFVNLNASIPVIYPNGSSIWLEIEADQAFITDYVSSSFTFEYIYGSNA